MVKNTLVIGLFFFIFLAFSASPTFAAKKQNPHSHNFTETTLTENLSTDEEEPESLHPSGNSRLEEPGNSYPQGNSESDPDDDSKGPDRSNGGDDKPGGTGGVQKIDQDGNNGCGNDNDFEDDNEGWCGSKPKDPEPCDDEDEGGHEDTKDEPEDEPKEEETEEPTGQVLGATTLPNTGSDLLGNLYFALTLISTGTGFKVLLRREENQ